MKEMKLKMKTKKMNHFLLILNFFQIEHILQLNLKEQINHSTFILDNY